MSRNLTKKKKSTSKYRNFKISPMIPVIAIIEVLVLIAISTYAWFVVSQEKNAYTGIIEVDADSGLDIDFKNATYNDHINLWDYVPEDFEFSPVTSLDGRNVFVPTSGTFGNNSTNSIKFREATINDINTKYVDVDFMLTNTNPDQEVKVYLNNRSHFRVYDNAKETSGEEMSNSRALRLAFYTNDAKHGNVSSQILENTANEDAILSKLENRYTVYFDKPTDWDTCKAYIWNGSGNPYISWPGSSMTHVAGNVYSYTFSNTDNYTKVIFNNGSSSNQTANLNLNNGYLYKSNGTSAPYNTKTVYFVKPSDWSGVRAYAFRSSGNTGSFTTSYPGDECYYCGGDVYSYTFPTTYNNYDITGILFNNLGNDSQKTADLQATDGTIYYFTPGGSNGACTASTYSTKTVYFYNTNSNNASGWSKPYAKLKGFGHEVRVPMTSLSSGIYYANVPSVYTQIGFEERNGFDDDTTAQTSTYLYTQYSSSIVDGQIYKPDTWTSTGYTMTDYSYTGYVGNFNNQNSYAVISPGVSAGFQRSYTPVVGAYNDTGVPSQVVPAFACSLDNYIKTETNPAMFTIPPNGMLDLSMVIWLEGTDADCTNTNYAAKNIDLYLEFSTSFTDESMGDVAASDTYTYRFYDKTREVWTGDRLTNAAGVSVAPVMQLYDATEKRGYLMKAASTTDYNNTRKIDLWECSAPAVLYTENHDLFFRRVDPYNEDEVWNYWHPDVKAKASGAALQSEVVSFTAFSDGAPANSTTDSAGIPGNTTVLTAARDASTPSTSCGGLWGTYQTTLFTVVDNTFNSNTGNHWLVNDGGVLTMKYTFKYANNQTQTIEYKASGPYRGQFYYFVVPTVLNTDSAKRPTSYTFHRFWGFNNSYAMNIYERNSSMSYNNTGTATISSYMRSYYAWLGQSKGATTIDQSWFGDLLYVNLSTGPYNNNGNEDVMNNAKYKLHMWDNSGTTWTECLYVCHDVFHVPDFTGQTYVAVLPYKTNGTRPTGMQLQRCSSNFNTVWNYSGNITVNTSNHNLFAYKWSGDTILTSYNNDQVNYGWPQIPSYTDNN